jgi:hypothetical protein
VTGQRMLHVRPIVQYVQVSGDLQNTVFAVILLLD